uniref:TBC domain-containing protein kinase-like protein n=1 Tax=Parascaris univalens TaxID=6257 RepID=A0A915ANT7_PARUN
MQRRVYFNKAHYSAADTQMSNGTIASVGEKWVRSLFELCVGRKKKERTSNEASGRAFENRMTQRIRQYCTKRFYSTNN